MELERKSKVSCLQVSQATCKPTLPSVEKNSLCSVIMIVRVDIHFASRLPGHTVRSLLSLIPRTHPEPYMSHSSYSATFAPTPLLRVIRTCSFQGIASRLSMRLNACSSRTVT